MLRHSRFLSLLLATLLFLAGCASHPHPLYQCAKDDCSQFEYFPSPFPAQGVAVVPSKDVKRYLGTFKKHPEDLDPARLSAASAQSYAYVSSKPGNRPLLTIPDSSGLESLPKSGSGRIITYGHAARTLQRLRTLLPHLQNSPELLEKNFLWLRVGPDFHFTGYYEPLLKASHTRTTQFRHPLYRTPEDFKRIVREEGHYYSRRAIDEAGVLRNRGLEIAWIEDPVDASILQIQGSGRLLFTDGTTRSILYAEQNKHKYRAIGRLMKEQGLLTPPITMYAIRKWLKEHPAETPEILYSDPSYVFFRLGKKNQTGSFGSMGRILTPGASTAVDQHVLPNGLLTFMSLPVPDLASGRDVPFQRLMFPQDSGGAIKGHRVDVFFGNGPQAEYAASCLDREGSVIILLAR